MGEKAKIEELQSDEIEKIVNRHWNDYGKLGCLASLILFKELLKRKIIDEDNFIKTQKTENDYILSKLTDF